MSEELSYYEAISEINSQREAIDTLEHFLESTKKEKAKTIKAIATLSDKIAESDIIIKKHLKKRTIDAILFSKQNSYREGITKELSVLKNTLNDYDWEISNSEMNLKAHQRRLARAMKIYDQYGKVLDFKCQLKKVKKSS